jgi:hypothetical protein
MNLDQICSLTEDIYWMVLREFGVDGIHDGYIEIGETIGQTRNTEKGQELYFAIESAIAEAVNFDYKGA